MRNSIGAILGTVFAMGCAEAPGATDGTGPTSLVSDNATGQTTAPLKVGNQPRAKRFPKAIQASLRAGSIRLSELQADRIGDNARNGLDDTDPDDGGWDFTLSPDAPSHSPTASPKNLYGATALGVWAAVRAGADTPRFRTTLLGAGLGAQEDPEIDSPTDLVFLPLLGELQDDDGFAQLARARYDARVRTVGSAQAIGERTRDARHAGNADGLIMYDLAWWHLGAAALDAAFPGGTYAADAATFATLAVNDLTSATPLFDVTNTGEQYYVQGLAWGLLLLSRANAPQALIASVQKRLLDAQTDSGAWGWNGVSTAANVQATAHAVQALSLLETAGQKPTRAASKGTSWLTSVQNPSGGWPYTSTLESPLLDGEVLLAVYLAKETTGDEDLTVDDGVRSTTAPLSLSTRAASSTPPLSAPSAD
jgi:hypothetical protein